MLRDRLVCGIDNSQIQQWLLAEPNLMHKAVEISLAMESADRKAKDLQKTQLSAVNALLPQVKPDSRAPPQASGAMSRTKAVECYRCGGTQNVSTRTLNANSVKRNNI